MSRSRLRGALRLLTPDRYRLPGTSGPQRAAGITGRVRPERGVAAACFRWRLVPSRIPALLLVTALLARIGTVPTRVRRVRALDLGTGGRAGRRRDLGQPRRRAADR
ncbi:hypothetical protein [Pseudonocardia sp. N23]|uniref:hypothetical protein n=1 Tax=Pseudonocardia sp. N23 TaxID=1987376 RepID=UPI000BFC7327|nr:hypothetical protein [Pseudonocardia sp. N23]